MTASRVRVVRASPGLVWRALDGDDIVGAASAFLRPDGRWFVHLDLCRDDSYEPLLAAVGENTGSDLYAMADERNKQRLALLGRLGFTVNRRESLVVIPTDPQITGLHVTDEPDGVVIISANDAYEDQLRLLDDALRQDVPGSSGWKWDPGDFSEETFGRQFDPATYLVAVEVASGDYVGLARVWKRPGKPRLGLIGVLGPHRQQGLARILLARVFRVLHQRGQAEVAAEIDDTNAPSRALLLPLGAKAVGGFVEFIRPHGAAH